MSLTPSELIPNPTDNPDVIDALNLSITRIDEDTIEIRSFASMAINAWFKIIFLTLMVALIPHYDPGWFTSDGKPGVAYSAIYNMLNREESIISAFLRAEDVNNPGYTRTGRTYEEFKAGQISHHGRGITAGVVFMGLIIVPWFLFNIAVLNPYRINRKHRIIYTWAKGCFLCIQLPENTRDPLKAVEAHIPKVKNPNDPHNVQGPLNLWLPYPKKQQNAVVSIGASCFLGGAVIRYQSYYLYDFLNDFLTNPNPQWLNQLGPVRKPKYVNGYNYFFYTLSRLQFLPQFPFKKRKTEKAIEEFMKNPRTELYPDYMPYQ